MADYTWPFSDSDARYLCEAFDEALEFNVELSVSRSGKVSTLSLPGARWRATMQFPDTGLSELVYRRQIEAFLVSLRGGADRLLIHNLLTPQPLGTMTGSVTLSASVAPGATTAQITGGAPAAGATLLRGDRVAFGGQRVMLTADATANGSGVATITFQPAHRAGADSGSGVTLVRPATKYVLMQPVVQMPARGSLLPGFAVELIEDGDRTNNAPFSENSTFNDEGDSTTGWAASNATLSTSAGLLRQTKTIGGTASSMTKTITFTPASKDYVLYGSIRCSMATNHVAAIWFLNGAKEVSIWLNSASANSSYTSGSISIRGTTGASTYNVASFSSGLDFSTTDFVFALQFDSTFNQLNLFQRVAGEWVFRIRVACDWFSASSISVLNSSTTPSGGYVEVDYLTLCSPNMIVVGDSMASGRNGFDPNPSFSRSDNSTAWHRYAQLMPSLRNNLVINKGRPSESTTATAARIAEATQQGAKLIFLHASTNDVAAAVSQSLRTSSTQSMVDSIVTSGALCVLLNASYGTSAVSDNSSNALRDYMLNWWANYRPSLTNVHLAIDQMTPVLSGGFLSASYSSDGIHLTAAGADIVGDYIAAASTNF